VNRGKLSRADLNRRARHRQALNQQQQVCAHVLIIIVERLEMVFVLLVPALFPGEEAPEAPSETATQPPLPLGAHELSLLFRPI
jgi:hypothetical protein